MKVSKLNRSNVSNVEAMPCANFWWWQDKPGQGWHGPFASERAAGVGFTTGTGTLHPIETIDERKARVLAAKVVKPVGLLPASTTAQPGPVTALVARVEKEALEVGGNTFDGQKVKRKLNGPGDLAIEAGALLIKMGQELIGVGLNRGIDGRQVRSQVGKLQKQFDANESHSIRSLLEEIMVRTSEAPITVTLEAEPRRTSEDDSLEFLAKLAAG